MAIGVFPALSLSKRGFQRDISSPRSAKPGKLSWQGKVIAVQPRIRLTRSFDERSHTYSGYALRVHGTIGDESREFLVGIGKGAHAKHQFQAGDTVCGMCESVADSRIG